MFSEERFNKWPQSVRKGTLYGIRLSDIMRLQKLTDAVNGESERPISETAVIKGLIALGEKTTPEKLLKLTREVW